MEESEVRRKKEKEASSGAWRQCMVLTADLFS